jgi:hypothetical protein
MSLCLQATIQESLNKHSSFGQNQTTATNTLHEGLHALLHASGEQLTTYLSQWYIS